MNLPNALTLARIFLVPLLVVVLLTKFEAELVFGVPKEVLGAAIFGLAALTDWLDGYLARRRNEITHFGQMMDPLADKLLITAALVSLVQMGLAETWMVAIILGRELAVTVLRSLAYGRGVSIPASRLGKVKMVTQVVAILLLILGNQVWLFWGARSGRTVARARRGVGLGRRLLPALQSRARQPESRGIRGRSTAPLARRPYTPPRPPERTTRRLVENPPAYRWGAMRSPSLMASRAELMRTVAWSSSTSTASACAISVTGPRSPSAARKTVSRCPAAKPWSAPRSTTAYWRGRDRGAGVRRIQNRAVRGVVRFTSRGDRWEFRPGGWMQEVTPPEPVTHLDDLRDRCRAVDCGDPHPADRLENGAKDQRSARDPTDEKLLADLDAALTPTTDHERVARPVEEPRGSVLRAEKRERGVQVACRQAGRARDLGGATESLRLGRRRGGGNEARRDDHAHSESVHAAGRHIEIDHRSCRSSATFRSAI